MLRKGVLCIALMFFVMTPFYVHAKNSVAENTESALLDSAITTKIKELYHQSALMNTTNISVVTHGKSVTLSGRLTSDLQYGEAISMAQSVDGVVDVNADHLYVPASKSPLTDLYITAKIKGTLIKEKLFGEKPVEVWPVRVETKNGVVFLTGIIGSKVQCQNIIKLTKGIHGVKSIHSSMTVK